MTDNAVLKLEEGAKIRAVNQKPAETTRIRTSNGVPIRSVAQNPTRKAQQSAVPRTTAQSPQDAPTSDKSSKD